MPASMEAGNSDLVCIGGKFRLARIRQRTILSPECKAVLPSPRWISSCSPSRRRLMLWVRSRAKPSKKSCSSWGLPSN